MIGKYQINKIVFLSKMYKSDGRVANIYNF